MLQLAHPWLLLLAPLPILGRLLLPARAERKQAVRSPFFATLAEVLGQRPSAGAVVLQRNLAQKLLLPLVWLLVVLALARPQWIGEPIELPTTGRDLMLAVDISGSMGTEDMQIRNRQATRLQVVKDVVGDFVERRKGDRLGLILFGSQAYLQTPLTFDRFTVRSLLTETPLGIAGGKTAIGDAIGLSVKRLHERPAESHTRS